MDPSLFLKESAGDVRVHHNYDTPRTARNTGLGAGSVRRHLAAGVKESTETINRMMNVTSMMFLSLPDVIAGACGRESP